MMADLDRLDMEETPGRKVLVVEDDDGLRRLIAKQLRKAGFVVLEAGTGRDAMELVVELSDVALLLDIKLPDMEGRKLVSDLRDQGQQTPFIVMTGQGDERLAVEMMKLGAKDYLVKGLDLLDMVPAACTRLFREQEIERRLCAAEAAHRESEQKYRELVENALSVIIKFDLEGRVTFFNEYAQELFGFTAQEMLGKDQFGTIIPETDSDGRDMRGLIPAICSDPERYRVNENENVTKDGRRLWMRWANRTIRDAQGRITGLLSVGLDISDRKQAERALLRAMEAAEAANKAKSEFLANMSHEVRTPLNGIMGLMQLLKTTELDAEQEKCVQLAIISANRLTRLLADILDLSRVESGRLEIEEKAFSLADLSASVSDLFTVSAGEKGLTLDCWVDPALPDVLVGDEARVRQILFNVVGNAVKYSVQGGVRLEIVPLSGTPGNDLRILFSVADTGIGIPEDRLRDVFQPFRQVDGSYTRQHQGAGLGLAIVRRLVDLLRGHLAVESVLGEGTTMHMVLPFRLPGQDDAGMEPVAAG
jgi:PAS domain S-box-containing protein